MLNLKLFKIIATPLFLSAFIYLEYFEISNIFLNSLFAIIGVYLWISLEKNEAFFVGFIVGILWFYWIGFSFRFTEYYYLSYIAGIAISLFFGIIFLIISWIKFKPLIALIIALGFDYLEPFKFVWFKPDILITNSFFYTSKVAFIIFIFAILILFYIPKNRKILLLIPLLIFLALINPNKKEHQFPDLKIKLVDLNLDQKTKWKREFQQFHINSALTHIKNAIDQKYDLVIIPETAFPTRINLNKSLTDELKNLSYKISIIAGGLSDRENNAYNSTYFFDKGLYTIADKVYLVPFGEEVPLPNWLTKIVNKIFFDGVDDFHTADKPTDFLIKGTLFRNAICYEATKKEMFINAPKYMIVTSNNAWFVPSIEPTLQKILMQMYARRNDVIIFHSSNQSKSEIIF